MLDEEKEKLCGDIELKGCEIVVSIVSSLIAIGLLLYYMFN